MRQGQQNRRGRGRNNNQQNRKGGQNPLTRSFESTGPDVKIRGTPAHIAEKYMALARDAQSSGDPVLAENYLQHAEHYTRIIMAFREQQMSQGGDMNGGMPRHRPGGFSDASMSDDFSEDDGEDMGSDVHGAPLRGNEPQPRAFEGGQQRFDERPQRQSFEGNRHHHQRHGNDQRGDQRGFSDRNDRPDRGDRHDRGDRFPRQDRPERVQQADAGFEGNQHPRRGPDRGGVPQHEQPEFLRRPVRRPRREENGAAPEETAAASSSSGDETGRE
jgi:hypothetical protein